MLTKIFLTEIERLLLAASGETPDAEKPKLTVAILDTDGKGPTVPGEPLMFEIRSG